MKKIVNDVLCLVELGKHNVWICIRNDKKQNTLLKKKAGPSRPVTIGTNEFNLEIELNEDEEPHAYIKSPELPSNDKYLVRNFDPKSTLPLLLEAKHQKGIFENKLEAVFNPYNNSLVTFMNEEMSEFKPSMDEYTRQVYCDLGKKTKKWVVGHRYDHENGTYYYLGEYLSTKKNDTNSEFYRNIDELSDVHLIATEIHDSDKTISDVFKNRRPIKIIRGKLPGAVDSGEALINDNPSLVSLYPEILSGINSIDIASYSKYLSLLSPSDIHESISPVVIELVEKVVDSNIEDILVLLWDRERPGSDKIYDGNDENTNIGLIKEQFFNTIYDGNINVVNYYTGFFKYLGINIEKRIKTVMNDWVGIDKKENLSVYMDNYRYHNLRRDNSKTCIYIFKEDEKTFGHQTLQESIQGDELRETLINLINHARSNYGEGVSEYGVYRGKDELTHIHITLYDVLSWLNNKISLTLEHEILETGFTEIDVYFNKNSEIA